MYKKEQYPDGAEIFLHFREGWYVKWRGKKMCLQTQKATNLIRDRVRALCCNSPWVVLAQNLGSLLWF